LVARHVPAGRTRAEYLRQNVSQTVLADMYGVSQPTVSRIYRAIMPLLVQVLCVHDPELTSVFVHREVLVDGTLVPTGNPADSKHNYSSKRLRQGLHIQVAAATDGALLGVSSPVAGGRHDRRAITECGWEPVLDNHTWYADAACIGTTATVPYKRSKYHDLTGYEQAVTKPSPPADPPSNEPSATSRTGKYSPLATAVGSPNCLTSSASPAASSSTAFAGDF
jgi:hypothetical protein